MKTIVANNSTYTSHSFYIGKTRYNVLVVVGKLNYVTVLKPGPFVVAGKQFENFDSAVRHYKHPSIKLELTKIELGI